MSSLSIPGTHDSAAYTSPWPFVSTQDMSFVQQLNSGIRYFDLRVGLRNDVAEMCHGLAFLGTRLSEVLNIMYEFLETHPREAIIVQIKQDRKPQESTVHFSQAIFQHISNRSERWRTANTTPTLAELRGKIQLFRRYTGHSLVAYGIDVTQWQDNPTEPFTIYNKLQLVTVQDHYSYSDPKPLPSLVESKGGDVAVLLDRASGNPDPAHWYINFMSAFEINLYFQIPPRNIAVGGYYLLRWIDGINARVQAYLQGRGGGKRFGIVAMDFPELGATELISLIILSNFERGNKLRKVLLLALLCCLLLSLVVALLFGRHPDLEFPVLSSTSAAAVS
jgi:1-phosphatidylinositol phosphodiesterase